MRRLAKALSAAAAILILAGGCTAQNPVGPEANQDRGVYANGED
ncbi:MAG: hypothetical protein WD766_04625 [Gemmatimonadota bacterium]